MCVLADIDADRAKNHTSGGNVANFTAITQQIKDRGEKSVNKAKILLSGQAKSPQSLGCWTITGWTE